MTTRQANFRTGASEQYFGPLADETRRRIIRLLRDRSDPVSLEELCTRLANGGSDAGPRSSTAGSEKMRSLQIRLHHIHLPKLEDSGLIEWDSEERTVAAIDHAVSAVQVEESLETADRGSTTSTSDRDREILDIVEAHNGSITRSELANELWLKEASSDRADRSIDEIEIRLHHCQLPQMADEGLIEYGPDGEITVAESEGRSDQDRFSKPL